MADPITPVNVAELYAEMVRAAAKLQVAEALLVGAKNDVDLAYAAFKRAFEAAMEAGK